MSKLTTALQPLLLGAVVLLSACNDHHETVHAVDVIPLAEQNAQAAAPVPEPITFDDEHLPKMGDTSADSAQTQDTSTDDTATAIASVATDSTSAEPAPESDDTMAADDTTQTTTSP